MTDQTNETTKFLDLDALTDNVGVSINLNGSKHQMAEMSVSDFVWAQNMTQKQKEIDGEPSEEQMAEVLDSMIDMLTRQFPTCPREDIAGLSFTKLTKLVKFAGDTGAAGAETAVAEAEEAGNLTTVVTDETVTPAQ